MRYELCDHEWGIIKLMLPNKPRGIPRVDDRRVLNGIFWVLRSGAGYLLRPRGAAESELSLRRAGSPTEEPRP